MGVMDMSDEEIGRLPRRIAIPGGGSRDLDLGNPIDRAVAVYAAESDTQWLNDRAQQGKARDTFEVPGTGSQPDAWCVDELRWMPSRMEAMVRRIEELTQQMGIALARVADAEDRVAQLTHDVAHLRAAEAQRQEKRPAFPLNALRWSR